MLNENYFRDYFDSKKLKKKKCLRDYHGRRNVYEEIIDGEKYYIKKYRPHKQRKRGIAFGVIRDRAEHYKYISDKLKKIGIPHAEPLVVLVNRISFFERESLYVTKKAGVHLEEYGIDKKLIQKFFDYFITMLKNKIYPTDYNTDGALVNSERELVLIDFDAYRQKIFLTRKFKEYVFIKFKNNFYKDFSEKIREEYVQYKKLIDENLETVKKELNL